MDPILAQLLLWPLNWAPSGWAQCAGQLMNINQNTALYSLLGTIYGGDGRTTFQLPDFRGRIPVGIGKAPDLNNSYNIAQKGGYEKITLSLNNLPAHNHTAVVTTTPISVTIKASPAGGTDNVPGTNGSTTLAASMAGRAAGSSIYNNQNPTVAMNTATVVSGGESTVAVGVSGNSIPFDNQVPYLAVNFIIALQGLYPTRD